MRLGRFAQRCSIDASSRALTVRPIGFRGVAMPSSRMAYGRSKRSPDERSDIRGMVLPQLEIPERRRNPRWSILSDVLLRHNGDCAVNPCSVVTDGYLKQN
jgi:hypothetical protein